MPQIKGDSRIQKSLYVDVSTHTKGFGVGTRIVTSALYELLDSDHTIFANCSSNPIDLYLPDTSLIESGTQYILTKIDSSTNHISIHPFGSQTINGLSLIQLQSKNAICIIETDGANWYTVSWYDYGQLTQTTITPREETFILNAGNLGSVTLAYTPATNSEFVILNGLTLHKNEDYTISGNVITFQSGCVRTIGDTLLVKYSTITTSSVTIPIVIDETCHSGYVKVDFNSASFSAGELSIGNIKSLSSVFRVVVIISNAFNNTPTISVGTDADHDLLMATTDNDPIIQGKYVEEPDQEFGVQTQVKLFFTGSPTVGSGSALVYFV